MSGAVAQENINPVTTSGSTCTATLTTIAGRLLHFTAMSQSNVSVNSISDSLGLTWNLLDNPLATNNGMWHWWAANPTGGLTTVTANLSFSLQKRAGILAEISGCKTGGSAIDGHNKGTTETTGTGANGLTTGNATNAAQPTFFRAVGWGQGSALAAGNTLAWASDSLNVSAGAQFGGVFTSEHLRVLANGNTAASFGSNFNGEGIAVIAGFSELSGSIALPLLLPALTRVNRRIVRVFYPR